MCVLSDKTFDGELRSAKLQNYFKFFYHQSSHLICATQFYKDAWYAIPQDVWKQNYNNLLKLFPNLTHNMELIAHNYSTWLCPGLPKDSKSQSWEYFANMVSSAVSANTTPAGSAAPSSTDPASSSTPPASSSASHASSNAPPASSSASHASSNAPPASSSASHASSNAPPAASNTPPASSNAAHASSNAPPAASSAPPASSSTSHAPNSAALTPSNVPVISTTPQNQYSPYSSASSQMGSSYVPSTTPMHTLTTVVGTPPVIVPIPMYSNPMPCAPTICPGSVGTNTSQKNSLRTEIQELREAIGSLTNTINQPPTLSPMGMLNSNVTDNAVGITVEGELDSYTSTSSDTSATDTSECPYTTIY
jgi:hypothetical protein